MHSLGWAKGAGLACHCPRQGPLAPRWGIHRNFTYSSNFYLAKEASQWVFSLGFVRQGHKWKTGRICPNLEQIIIGSTEQNNLRGSFSGESNVRISWDKSASVSQLPFWFFPRSIFAKTRDRNSVSDGPGPNFEKLFYFVVLFCFGLPALLASSCERGFKQGNYLMS